MSGTKKSSSESLLKYYQDYSFNPVPIDVEDKAIRESHAAVRRNLYEKRLMLPLSLFKNRSVLEFGCNSGENALHLASLGAKLTLVEPNDQVLPRLTKLFGNCGYEKSIEELANKDIAGFESQKQYDIVLAEGFLAALEDRDEMLLRICSFLVPDGMGVVSFDDRHGSLLEVTRQLVLRRACQMEGIEDIHGEEALKIAKELYEEDLANLNASRRFEAWWKDNLLNPFVAWPHLWEYPGFLAVLEKAGCEFYSSSPRWDMIDHFSWWKNVSNRTERHKRLLEEWYRSFPFFLTGLPLSNKEVVPATAEVVDAVSGLIKDIYMYTSGQDTSIDSITYPAQLDDYFSRMKDEEFISFNTELKGLFNALKKEQAADLINAYHNTKYVRKLWGTPCQYVCFCKSG